MKIKQEGVLREYIIDKHTLREQLTHTVLHTVLVVLSSYDSPSMEVKKHRCSPIQAQLDHNMVNHFNTDI